MRRGLGNEKRFLRRSFNRSYYYKKNEKEKVEEMSSRKNNNYDKEEEDEGEEDIDGVDEEMKEKCGDAVCNMNSSDIDEKKKKNEKLVVKEKNELYVNDESFLLKNMEENNNDKDEDNNSVICPLCVEVLDETDRNFFPCDCGYQICLWCLYYIRDNMNNTCPACRRSYDEKNFIYNRETHEKLIKKPKSNKNKSDNNNINKGDNNQMDNNNINTTTTTTTTNNNNTSNNNNNNNNTSNNNNNTSNNNNNDDIDIDNDDDDNSSDCSVYKALDTISLLYRSDVYKPSNIYNIHEYDNLLEIIKSIRVVQRNLVFVIGITATYAKKAVLKKNEHFGKYGKILNIIINKSQAYNPQYNGPSFSAYITYSNEKEAINAIYFIDGMTLDNKILKASFGTTKYCSSFLKNSSCGNEECFYLHELGNVIDSFSKDDIHGPKHIYHDLLYLYFKKLPDKKNDTPYDSLANNIAIKNFRLHEEDISSLVKIEKAETKKKLENHIEDSTVVNDDKKNNNINYTDFKYFNEWKNKNFNLEKFKQDPNKNTPLQNHRQSKWISEDKLLQIKKSVTHDNIPLQSNDQENYHIDYDAQDNNNDDVNDILDGDDKKSNTNKIKAKKKKKSKSEDVLPLDMLKNNSLIENNKNIPTNDKKSKNYLNSLQNVSTSLIFNSYSDDKDPISKKNNINNNKNNVVNDADYDSHYLNELSENYPSINEALLDKDKKKKAKKKAEKNKAEKNKAEKNKAEKNKEEKNKAEKNKEEKNTAEKNKADKNKADKKKTDTNKADTNKVDTNKTDTNKSDTNKMMTKEQCEQQQKENDSIDTKKNKKKNQNNQMVENKKKEQDNINKNNIINNKQENKNINEKSTDDSKKLTSLITNYFSELLDKKKKKDTPRNESEETNQEINKENVIDKKKNKNAQSQHVIIINENNNNNNNNNIIDFSQGQVEIARKKELSFAVDEKIKKTLEQKENKEGQSKEDKKGDQQQSQVYSSIDKEQIGMENESLEESKRKGKIIQQKDNIKDGELIKFDEDKTQGDQSNTLTYYVTNEQDNFDEDIENKIDNENDKDKLNENTSKGKKKIESNNKMVGKKIINVEDIIKMKSINNNNENIELPEEIKEYIKKMKSEGIKENIEFDIYNKFINNYLNVKEYVDGINVEGGIGKNENDNNMKDQKIGKHEEDNKNKLLISKTEESTSKRKQKNMLDKKKKKNKNDDNEEENDNEQDQEEHENQNIINKDGILQQENKKIKNKKEKEKKKKKKTKTKTKIKNGQQEEEEEKEEDYEEIQKDNVTLTKKKKKKDKKNISNKKNQMYHKEMEGYIMDTIMGIMLNELKSKNNVKKININQNNYDDEKNVLLKDVEIFIKNLCVAKCKSIENNKNKENILYLIEEGNDENNTSKKKEAKKKIKRNDYILYSNDEHTFLKSHKGIMQYILKNGNITNNKNNNNNKKNDKIEDKNNNIEDKSNNSEDKNNNSEDKNNNIDDNTNSKAKTKTSEYLNDKNTFDFFKDLIISNNQDIIHTADHIIFDKIFNEQINFVQQLCETDFKINSTNVISTNKKTDKQPYQSHHNVHNKLKKNTQGGGNISNIWVHFDNTFQNKELNEKLNLSA
ncbi:CCR4-NOT transcription complex subunit 4, putative [Plasmodium gaboni]|uniref:CCR4-NOT transcription complex subunit 4, putative n=1 Tax=Plasmodium gaboni TaxID=647221 RepID=A0ABY1UQT3_9APIC|nr:CCR4-NOT transcription complex subunit 4, putative [Plasmodium gaboni]